MKVTELQTKYKLPVEDFWEVRKGTWVISHNGCEKIADIEKIKFYNPVIYTNANLDRVAMIGSARMEKGEEIWATGESNDDNTKGQGKYYFAMAEKRLKDRLILKLINAAQYGLYSETEADSFKDPKTPQKPSQTPPSENIIPHTKQPFGKNENKFIEGMNYGN